MKPITHQGYKLLHDGCIALSEVEANGIRIDTDYLKKMIEKTGRQIQQITEQLKEDKIYKTWRKRYGSKTNMDSKEQLGKILFDVMEYPCHNRTKTGRPKADEEALKETKLPFVKLYLKAAKLKKAKNTYLKGILRETVDGFLHPFFNLHLVRSLRGSSDHPNFQNQPVRNPVIRKLVRRAFIARKNHHIVEVDYSGAEICSAACYHHDPRMIRYIENDKLDLHRDMAAQLYLLKKSQVTKDARYCGKNMYVFPQFYGDYYVHCAEHLWKAISKMSLKTVDGLSLRKHLREQGIKRLGKLDPDLSPRDGTFEKHVQEVEDDFWKRRFKVYNQWKQDWYYDYLDNGYFDTLTGFRIEGMMNRKQVVNYPPQGDAFHWLLWSLIRIMKLLRKYKMKSWVGGQIHDSIVGDVHRKERKDYLEICKQVMTIDVRKHWPWIIVPLKIEAEVAPVGGSWYDKEEVEI